MTDIEHILDFAVNLGGHMISSGASLERVNDTVRRICISYQLHSISIFSLNSTLIVSAKDKNRDNPTTRQISISTAGIHLEKLNRLNRLARQVCKETPAPSSLNQLMTDVQKTSGYPVYITWLAFLIAMISLNVIFRGNVRDAFVICLITSAIFWINNSLVKINLNRIIANIICMFITGMLALYFTAVMNGLHFYVIIIVLSMMMIPGIPMVNSIQNLLCGNEMNGILTFFRVAIETAAICFGLVLSIYIGKHIGGFAEKFSGFETADTMPLYILFVIFSFTASIGFGIVFQMKKEHLIWAGIGGALTRIVLLFLSCHIDQRALFCMLAAMFAALYAECMARFRKVPSTLYLYPAIIPLIPGDSLYNTIVHILLTDTEGILLYGEMFLLTLIGISLGFVLISTIVHYKRFYIIRRDFASQLLHISRKY